MLNEIENITALVLQHNLDLELSESEENDLFCIRKALIQKINYLLTYNFSKLLWILYRIDVKEEEVKNCFTKFEQQTSEMLADLIIKRQMEKAKTRVQYRQQ